MTGHDTSYDSAYDSDDAAAVAVDTEIRVLSHPDDLRHLVELLNQVWGTVQPLVAIEVLRAIGHSGGYVSGAYTDGRMVGGSLGFLARHRGTLALHSHVTGILPGVRKTGLGRQMKLHQRQWAIDQGLDWVTWTFDPLVRRNAWFNIAVLGASIDRYLPDFYGQMHDTINGTDPTDRLLVAWATDESAPGPSDPPPTAAITVPTPDDIVVLRRTDPTEASAWRLRLREELGGALADGAAVVGFTRDGNYLLAPAT